MKVVFRADASTLIGSGHVMRCLTLADALKEDGASCLFLCREFPGHLFEAVAARGHELVSLPPPGCDSSRSAEQSAYGSWLGVPQEEDARQCLASLARPREHADVPADWLVLDHYALERRWQSVGRAIARRVLVIDDLCSRSLQADALLNPNPGVTPRDYASLLTAGCTLMLGPEYALLRPEFRAARLKSRERDGRIKSILVNFGGSDAGNLTSHAWTALEGLAGADIRVDLVVGQAYPFTDALRQQISGRQNVRLHIQAANMADLMEAADLMLGTAGSTSWERCCLGLPSILLVCAENQEGIARALENTGACLNLGYGHPDIPTALAAALRHCLADPSLVKALGDNARALVDGLGVQRVLAAMKKLT